MKRNLRFLLCFFTILILLNTVVLIPITMAGCTHATREWVINSSQTRKILKCKDCGRTFLTVKMEEKTSGSTSTSTGYAKTSDKCKHNNLVKVSDGYNCVDCGIHIDDKTPDPHDPTNRVYEDWSQSYGNGYYPASEHQNKMLSGENGAGVYNVNSYGTFDSLGEAIKNGQPPVININIFSRDIRAIDTILSMCAQVPADVKINLNLIEPACYWYTGSASNVAGVADAFSIYVEQYGEAPDWFKQVDVTVYRGSGSRTANKQVLEYADDLQKELAQVEGLGEVKLETIENADHGEVMEYVFHSQMPAGYDYKGEKVAPDDQEKKMGLPSGDNPTED